MSENNAVTKEELKEVMADMRQEFRQGLAETNQNVFAIRQKVDGLGQKVDGLGQKVDGLGQKVDGLGQKVDGLEHKVDGLEHKVDGLEHKVDGLERKVDGLEHKVDANEQKLGAFRVETLARFDVADQKHDAVVKMIAAHEKKTDAQYEDLRVMLSKLMTGMDAEMREHEIIRHEQLSLGVIQDRHGRDIEAIKKHLGLEGNNGKRRENTAKKQPLKRNRKSK